MLIAGVVLATGPLLGAMVSVVQVLRAYAAAAGNGQRAAEAVIRIQYRPIAYGFAAFLPGILLLSLSVLGYSWRLKRHRAAHRD